MVQLSSNGFAQSRYSVHKAASHRPAIYLIHQFQWHGDLGRKIQYEYLLECRVDD